ncbi:MAG: manganese catalase family protein [Clostridiales bacterium]|jgi:bacterioferritin|nr:manganese catalase family protein [Clostridiales bacterium]
MSEIGTIQYRANLPYPKINITQPNEEYARLLMEDYCGAVSELRAVLQYTYGSFVTDGYADLKSALRNIGIVEMLHLELLSVAIIQLGGDPKFHTEDYPSESYNCDDVVYVKTVNGIILANIELESISIANYRKHIAMIDDTQVNGLLERIILDEEVHYDILNKFYVKYTLSPRPTPPQPPESNGTVG